MYRYTIIENTEAHSLVRKILLRAPSLISNFVGNRYCQSTGTSAKDGGGLNYLFNPPNQFARSEGFGFILGANYELNLRVSRAETKE